MSSVTQNHSQGQLALIHSDNYDAAFKLQTMCHAYPWSRAQFIDCLTSPYFAQQLLIDDTVVGYYVGMGVAQECTLMDLGIHQDYRGQGLGKAVLKGFLLACNSQQAEQAWLEVRRSNTAAINLYRQFGFVDVEVRRAYYPAPEGREDAIVMKLELGR